jgi:hypothetical protein
MKPYRKFRRFQLRWKEALGAPGVPLPLPLDTNHLRILDPYPPLATIRR